MGKIVFSAIEEPKETIQRTKEASTAAGSVAERFEEEQRRTKKRHHSLSRRPGPVGWSTAPYDRYECPPPSYMGVGLALPAVSRQSRDGQMDIQEGPTRSIRNKAITDADTNDK